jgi:hypothetical protein
MQRLLLSLQKPMTSRRRLGSVSFGEQFTINLMFSSHFPTLPTIEPSQRQRSTTKRRDPQSFCAAPAAVEKRFDA